MTRPSALARPARLVSIAQRVAAGALAFWALGAAPGCSSRPPGARTRCSQTGSPLTVCPEGAVVRGIDVSSYQGAIAWEEARAAGVVFAFARVSDGTTATDARFTDNWRAMKTAGVVRGAYQFFRASEDPAAQASLVVSMLQDAGGLEAGDLPVVMDIETADGASSATVRANMAWWLDAVERATGAAPIVYTNAATSAVIGAAFGDAALWVANWDATCPLVPAGWSAWTFWQYSSTGSVPGVPAAVDLDEFDGTPGDLATFASFAGRAGLDAAMVAAGDARAGDAGDSAAEAGAGAAMAGGGGADASRVGPGTPSGPACAP
jgi:GH25 family lysozyme M1 (1,4-beta-N-acetylmuramidase)